MSTKQDKIDKIEQLSKKLHVFAQAYEAACKAGNGFEASEVVGSISEIVSSLRIAARECHGENLMIDRVTPMMDSGD